MTGRLAGASSKPQSQGADLPALLLLFIDVVCQAGQILVAEWERVDGPRGPGDKAVIDVEIEHLLRQQLPDLFFCDFWGEETDCKLAPPNLPSCRDVLDPV